MNDLKIPNLNNKSDKFIFKKKLTLSRKSKGKLMKESFIMFSFGTLIFYLNYLIPNKILVFNNLFNNLNKLLGNVFNSLTYIFEILLAIFIVLSITLAVILILASFLRVLKIVKRKTNRIILK